MEDNLPSPNVPKVDLMNPAIEPTEQELKAMMSDVHERAIRKWNATHTAFWDAIEADMRACQNRLRSDAHLS